VLNPCHGVCSCTRLKKRKPKHRCTMTISCDQTTASCRGRLGQPGERWEATCLARTEIAVLECRYSSVLVLYHHRTEPHLLSVKLLATCQRLPQRYATATAHCYYGVCVSMRPLSVSETCVCRLHFGGEDTLQLRPDPRPENPLRRSELPRAHTHLGHLPRLRAVA